MWISLRTAKAALAAVGALALLRIAAPFLPRPHLPSLPEERVARRGTKFGAATAVLDAPERVRAQRMAPGKPTLPHAAAWGARVGHGPAVEPSAEAVGRLLTLLRDARTVADPRAAQAEPTLVVRLAKGDQRADVMLDPAHDRIVLALDGAPAATFHAAALHREFAALARSILP